MKNIQIHIPDYSAVQGVLMKNSQIQDFPTCSSTMLHNKYYTCNMSSNSYRNLAKNMRVFDLFMPYFSVHSISC